VHSLRKQNVLSAITERVRFARRRFGHYEVVDFVAVLFGYAISGERTLEAFYEHLSPFAPAFMALFGRDRLPARSTLSRFLAALPEEPVEALRALFLSDLLARPLVPESESAGRWDRTASQWQVFDIDGTREAARQRALPASVQSFLHPSVASVHSVLRATLGASEEKWSVPELRSCRLIPISGSARSAGQAMARHGRNYAERWPKSNATSRRISFPQSACW
jgi:hypothetical protein